jgi:hypothetical protein
MEATVMTPLQFAGRELSVTVLLLPAETAMTAPLLMAASITAW